MKSAKRSAGSDTARADAGGEFEGYTGAADTERKILRDVFERRRRLVSHRRSDAQGRARLLLFRRSDRRHLSLEGRECGDVGSRGRAHGVPRHRRGNVYGVAVPGTEGAAGMAALVVDRTLDFAELRRHLAKRLPAYARPLFLRLYRQYRRNVDFQTQQKPSSRAKASTLPRCAMRSISTIRNGRPMCRSMPRFISGSTPEKFGSKPEF